MNKRQPEDHLMRRVRPVNLILINRPKIGPNEYVTIHHPNCGGYPSATKGEGQQVIPSDIALQRSHI